MGAALRPDLRGNIDPLAMNATALLNPLLSLSLVVVAVVVVADDEDEGEDEESSMERK
jgi:hypothetical protein